MNPAAPQNGQPHLLRRFGLLQATALNMSNMIGIGPFITIPLLMSALGGPQALLGWLVALVIVVADGLVWSELGAAMPGSGGSYTLGMGFTAKAADSKDQVFYMLSETFGLASIDIENNFAISMTGALKNISGELTGGPDARLFTYEADNGNLSEVMVGSGYTMQKLATRMASETMTSNSEKPAAAVRRVTARSPFAGRRIASRWADRRRCSSPSPSPLSSCRRIPSRAGRCWQCCRSATW